MTRSSATCPEHVQLPTRTALIKTVLHLKLKLYGRGQSGVAQLFLGIGAVLVALLTVGSVTGIVYFRSHASAPDALAVGGSIIVLGWILMPILGGGERFLNPKPFSLLPVPLTNLLLAFLVASTVGIFAAASTIVVLAASTHASNIVQLFLMLVTSVVTWATFVLFGRLSVAVSNVLQSRRRGRDVATIISALAGISVAILGQSFLAVAELVTAERLAAARTITRWLPWGWAAETMALASSGELAKAFRWLVPSALLPVGLFWSWRRLMASLLTTKSEQAKPTLTADVTLRPLRKVKDTTLAASFSRGVLQLRRDPREKLQLVSMLPLLFVAAFPVSDLLRSGDERIVLTTIAWGASTGFIAANLFGADGASVGVELLASTNSRSLLLGKALVRVAIVMPIILLFSLALAIFSGGWNYLAASVFMATSLSVSSVGFGMNLSVRQPYPLPDNMGFTSNNISNGLLPGLLLFAMIAAALLTMAPFIVPAIVVSLVWSTWVGTGIAFVGLLWSIVVFLWSSQKAAVWVDAHRPEFFAALSRPSS